MYLLKDETIADHCTKLITSEFKDSIDYWVNDSRHVEIMRNKLSTSIEHIQTLAGSPQLQKAVPILIGILSDVKRHLEDKAKEAAENAKAAKENPPVKHISSKSFKYQEGEEVISISSINNSHDLKKLFLNKCDDDLSNEKALFIVANQAALTEKIIKIFTVQNQAAPTQDAALNKLTTYLQFKINDTFFDAERANRITSLINLHTSLKSFASHVVSDPDIAKIIDTLEKVILSTRNSITLPTSQKRVPTKNFQYQDGTKIINISSINAMPDLRNLFINKCDDDLSKRKALFIVGNQDELTEKIIKIFTEQDQAAPTQDVALNKLVTYLQFKINEAPTDAERTNRISYLTKLHTSLKNFGSHTVNDLNMAKIINTLEKVILSTKNPITLPTSEEELMQLFLGGGENINSTEILLKAELIYKNSDKLAKKTQELMTLRVRTTPTLERALNIFENYLLQEMRKGNSKEHLIALKMQLEKLIVENKESLKQPHNSNSVMYPSVPTVSPVGKFITAIDNAIFKHQNAFVN
ncbi:MAG: hypothetical protein ACK4PR_03910 [Gammaproteobacteria bacterium]